VEAPVPRLGNYELLMLLASGGMANVYAARQVGAAGFQRLVVVKRVHTHLLQDRTFYDMFRDEAAMASLVRHPNVVPVTDVVEADGELFLVMDYIEGVALSTVLKSAKEAEVPVPPRVGVRMVLDALLGLHAAHEVVDMSGNKLELVHRDVSPHNVLVGTDGICRLIDFGVAKAAHRSTQTRSGAIKGKYPYMSPEHARGDAVDRRSDIFAAGIVLHETLTGRRLFQGENDLDTLRRVMEAPIPESSHFVVGLPPEIDVVLRKALSRDASLRYQTAQDFVDAVEQALPPASHREVAAFMQEICKARLTERRNAIQSLLEGKLPPLSVRQARAGDPVTASHHVVKASNPPAPPPLGPSDATVTDGGSKGTQITHDASIPPPGPPSRGRFAVLALLAAAALGVVGTWLAMRSSAGPGPGALAGASASAHAAASGAPAADAGTAVASGSGTIAPAGTPHEVTLDAGAAEARVDGDVHTWGDTTPTGTARPHATATSTGVRPPPGPRPPPPGPAVPQGELHPSPYGP